MATAAYLLLLALTVSCSLASSCVGTPWPMPQIYITGSDYLVIPTNFTFTSNLQHCDVLDKAFDRYKKIILQTDCARAAKPLTANNAGRIENGDKLLQYVHITVNGICEMWPSKDMVEDYDLQVNIPYEEYQIQIASASVWGVLRALETLSQIVYLSKDGKLVVNTTKILDYPRFSFRGMMLDTSRHFVPKNVLLQNLDAMVQNKLNVFHWHIVDDQSFPYQSVKFPNLSLKGAFDPKTHIYTFNDIAEILDYARLRGIRVIPEFDTPGHTESWGPGQPDFLTPCYNKGAPSGTYGPVNPTLNTTFSFLQNFFAEAGKLFPESYVHLGGDEVSFTCWKSNPDILDFMKQQGFGEDFAKLEEYYEQKVVDIIEKLGKNFIVWQEVFDNHVNISKNTVIHVWKGEYENELANVTKAGYEAILSSCWYLNYISYGVDWMKYYQCDPWAFNGTLEQKKLVVGGAACMWGEYIDGSNLISTTWARASAVAERLWSSSDLQDVNSAAPRLEEQRCRMLRRGLNTQPIYGPGYCPCDIYFP